MTQSKIKAMQTALLKTKKFLINLRAYFSDDLDRAAAINLLIKDIEEALKVEVTGRS